MVTAKSSRYRKREYILVKHGMKWMYARISSDNPDQYNVMAAVNEPEGRIIVARGNEQSKFNREVDDAIDGIPFDQPRGDMEGNFPPEEKSKKRRSKKSE